MMKSTALGANMIKLRIQGTKEDIEWAEAKLKEVSSFNITESSDIFCNKGTNKYFRKYLEIKRTCSSVK